MVAVIYLSAFNLSAIMHSSSDQNLELEISHLLFHCLVYELQQSYPEHISPLFFYIKSSLNPEVHASPQFKVWGFSVI